MKNMMRTLSLVIILIGIMPLSSAQQSDTIVVHDSLAVVVPPVGGPSLRKTDSICLAATIPVPYPPGRAASTVLVADLIKPTAFCGAFLIGGILAMPFVEQDGEWGGLAAFPAAITIGAAADMTAGTMVIHRMNRKYVNSSPWYAAGGLLLHSVAGAGLMYLLREDRQVQEIVGYTAYLTAPITATAAYVLLGKSKHRPVTVKQK